MKRIKDKDWTRVLQERLQDAQLPLEDGWAKGVVVPEGLPAEIEPDSPANPARPGQKPEGQAGNRGCGSPSNFYRYLPWRKAWPPTPVFLPGESPWTEESDGLQSMGSQRVRHN